MSKISDTTIQQLALEMGENHPTFGLIKDTTEFFECSVKDACNIVAVFMKVSKQSVEDSVRKPAKTEESKQIQDQLATRMRQKLDELRAERVIPYTPACSELMRALDDYVAELRHFAERIDNTIYAQSRLRLAKKLITKIQLDDEYLAMLEEERAQLFPINSPGDMRALPRTKIWKLYTGFSARVTNPPKQADALWMEENGIVTAGNEPVWLKVRRGGWMQVYRKAKEGLNFHAFPGGETMYRVLSGVDMPYEIYTKELGKPSIVYEGTGREEYVGDDIDGHEYGVFFRIPINSLAGDDACIRGGDYSKAYLPMVAAQAKYIYRRLGLGEVNKDTPELEPDDSVVRWMVLLASFFVQKMKEWCKFAEDQSLVIRKVIPFKDAYKMNELTAEEYMQKSDTAYRENYHDTEGLL